MTTTPEPDRINRIRNAPLQDKTCAWWDCGATFTPKAPGQKSCCPEHAALVAEERAEQRKAKTGQKSGRGEPATTKKLKDRAEFVAEEIQKGGTMDRALKKLEKERPDLALTARFGIIPFRGTPENKAKIIDALQHLNAAGEVPSLEAAAIMAGGRASSVASIESWMKVDDEFKRAVKAEQAGYKLQTNRAMHRVAVEGVDKAIVSGGVILGTEKVYDSKALIALNKQFDEDFKKANSSAGGGVTVNVGINNNTGMKVDETDRPHALIFLDETWRLTDVQREQLAAIYAKVLQIRESMESAPKLSWDPPEDVRAELEAEDIAYREVESDDDI